MERWTTRPLAEVCDLNPPKREVRQKLSVDAQVSFVPMEQLGICQKSIQSNGTRSLGEVYGGYTYFAERDVLLAKITPCFENGKLGIATGLENGVGFGSSEFHVLRCGPSLLPEFLFYFLSQQSIRDNGARLMTGAVGHKRVPLEYVQGLNIPVPPLPEQKRIVAILDEAFEGIDKAIANTEKNIANARELFDAHLETTCRQVAAASPARPLADLCKSDRVITYGVIKLGEHYEDGVPCLRTSNVRWLHIDEDGMKRISPALSHDYRRTVLSGGEVLVNVRGSLGGVAVSASHMAGWNVSREVAVVPLEPSQAVADFVAYCVGSRSSQRWLSGVLKGVAYTGINIEDLRNLPVPTPSLTEQQKVVETLREALGGCRSAEDAYTRKLLALRELRQSILAQAFSGHLSGLTGAAA
ncbi:MAG: restriction endonuclease subunit S [Hyphomicrobiaceae bacterium]